MATRERQKAENRKNERANGPARAMLRGVSVSARKAKALADLVRGQSVEKALTALSFQHKKAAKPIRTALSSAVANAADRGWDVDRLLVSFIQVHKGPIAKRFMPRAQGRAYPIRKQSAHVEVELTQV